MTPLADVGYRMGLSLDQSPLLYTEGTEYLMPGPAGNLYQVPSNRDVRKVIVEQALRATQTFQSVNMPDPPPELEVRRACDTRYRTT